MKRFTEYSYQIWNAPIIVNEVCTFLIMLYPQSNKLVISKNEAFFECWTLPVDLFIARCMYVLTGLPSCENETCLGRIQNQVSSFSVVESRSRIRLESPGNYCNFMCFQKEVLVEILLKLREVFDED